MTILSDWHLPRPKSPTREPECSTEEPFARRLPDARAALVVAGFPPEQIALLERLRAEWPAREFVDQMPRAWFTRWLVERELMSDE